MQASFLTSYPKLLTPSSPQPLTLTGLWLAHGDEPILSGWLVDAMRPHWQAHNLALKRIELTSSQSWQEVLT